MSFKFDQKRIDTVLTNKINKLLKSNPNNILPITQVGEPVLRTLCKDYKGGLNPELLRKLISAMKLTMRKAPGVGLAAPQIGLDIKLAVIEDTSIEDSEEVEDDGRDLELVKFYTIINPKYEILEDDSESPTDFYEGCLSFANHYALRKRAYKIKAFWTDEKGKDHTEILKGWHARIFQHETDHLFGEIYIDKAEIRSLTTSENLSKFDWDSDPENTAKVLGFNL